MQQSFSYGENTKGRYYRIGTGTTGRTFIEPVAIPSHVLEERRRLRRRREIAQSVRRNRARAAQINARLLLLMTAALAAFAVLCGIYISMQRQVLQRMDTVTQLKTQVQEQSVANADLEARIGISADLNEVKKSARSELGMQDQSNAQVRYYSVSKDDFVMQYSDID